MTYGLKWSDTEFWTRHHANSLLGHDHPEPPPPNQGLLWPGIHLARDDTQRHAGTG